MIIEATATMSGSITASAVAKEGALTSSDASSVISTKAGIARLDHDEPFAPAEGNPANADLVGVPHCCPDHPKGLIRNPAIGIDVVRGVEINRIDFGARDKGFKIDDLRAFHVQRLQLLGGENHKLAALIFVPFDDLVALERFASVRVVRAKGEAGGGGRFQLCVTAYVRCERAPRRLRLLFVVLGGNATCGLRLPHLMHADRLRSCCRG